MSVPLAFERPVGELAVLHGDDGPWQPAPQRSLALAVVLAAAATVGVFVLVDVVVLLTVGPAV